MVSGAGLTLWAVEEVVLRLKELLFPANADIAVLSVGVDIERERVDAQCMRLAPPSRDAESARPGFTAPTCGFSLMSRAPGEASYFSCGSGGSGAGIPSARAGRSWSRYPA